MQLGFDMSLIVHLEKLEDTCKDINKTYQLTDIIFLTMFALLSGAQGWKDIQLFGERNIVEREYRVLPVNDGITAIDEWLEIKSIVEVNRVHYKQDKQITETSYYISSLAPSLSYFLKLFEIIEK